MIIPPFPTTVVGIDVACPQLDIPDETCQLALDVLSSKLFEANLMKVRAICGAYCRTHTNLVGFNPDRCRLFVDAVADTLEGHTYITSYLIEEFDIPVFRQGTFLQLRMAWVDHIILHLRRGLENEKQ